MEKDSIRWRDIVLIKGEYYLEEHEVELEEELKEKLKGIKMPNTENEILDLIFGILGEDDSVYDCGDFFEAVRKKYNLASTDEIRTYLFDDIPLPDYVCKKYDIAWLGGYINQFNI